MLALLAFVASATTALGLWQVQRLGWKKALIARVEARVHAKPVTPPESAWSALNREQHEYLRVQVSGSLQHDLAIPVYASTMRGPGFWVMTPLITEHGTIWVNRGFVDLAHKNPATRPHDHGNQSITITGLIRLPEHAGLFVRANVPDEQRWYARNPDELSAAQELASPSAPWFLDQQANPSSTEDMTWPIPGMTVIAFRNSHLSYALTWFALAGLSLCALVVVVRQRR